MCSSCPDVAFAPPARDLLFELVPLCLLSPLSLHSFLSFHPSLPVPEQQSEKYTVCPLNYFHLKLELALADPAAAEPQHFLYRILPVKFIRWCSITLIKMQ